MERLSLTVTGMSCTGCESRIAVALERLDGVGEVKGDHRAGRVVVSYEPARVDAAVISRRLRDAGYETTSAGAER